MSRQAPISSLTHPAEYRMVMTPPALWSRDRALASQFVYRCSLELGRGWRQALLPALPDTLSGSLQMHTWLSRHIAQQQGWPEGWQEGIEDPLLCNVVLLSPEVLEAYLQRLGAVFFSGEIRQAISRQSVSAYRAALPCPLYEFSLQCASLMTNPIDTGPPLGPEFIKGAIEHSGRQALRRLCANHATWLWPRLRIKLPLHDDEEKPPEWLSVLDIADLERIGRRVLMAASRTDSS